MPDIRYVCLSDLHLGADNSILTAIITFLFGHTHKPFQQWMNFTDYPAPLKVYNSGGWVVDTVNISPLHGAAVLLLDDALNTVSLRMYNQAFNPRDYTVCVEELTHNVMTENAFFRHLRASVTNERDPWKTFSEIVAEAVDAHAQLLKTKIAM